MTVNSTLAMRQRARQGLTSASRLSARPFAHALAQVNQRVNQTDHGLSSNLTRHPQPAGHGLWVEHTERREEHDA